MIAFFAALSWLIVWFGGFAAIVLAFLVGFAVSPLTGVVTALFTLLILTFLEFVVQPRLFNHAWVSSLLLLITVVFMVSQYGVFGFVFAPPLAAAVQILGRQLLAPPQTAVVPSTAPPVVGIDILRDRLNAIQTNISQNSESASPEIQSLVVRLDKLLEEAKQEEPFVD